MQDLDSTKPTIWILKITKGSMTAKLNQIRSQRSINLDPCILPPPLLAIWDKQGGGKIQNFPAAFGGRDLAYKKPI